MNTIWWIAGGSVLCGVVARAVLGPEAGVDVLFGAMGPALVAMASVVAIERTYRQHPERLTARMTVAFAGKMLFFGAYVALMLGFLSLRPIPFIVSFTLSFIVLHTIEGLSLRRLFAGEAREVR